MAHLSAVSFGGGGGVDVVVVVVVVVVLDLLNAVLRSSMLFKYKRPDLS